MQYEEVKLSKYNNFTDARNQIGNFIENVYMTKPIHSALEYLTPSEFETIWRLTRPNQTTPLWMVTISNCIQNKGEQTWHKY